MEREQPKVDTVREWTIKSHKLFHMSITQLSKNTLYSKKRLTWTFLKQSVFFLNCVDNIWNNLRFLEHIHLVFCE